MEHHKLPCGSLDGSSRPELTPLMRPGSDGAAALDDTED